MAGDDASPPPFPPSKSSSRPTLSLPPRTFNESVFTGGHAGGSGLGFSPGPMTLVSSFFYDSDSDDCKSFSQLLAGAMSSPSSALPPNRPLFPPPDTKSSGKPVNLSISPPPPMFTVQPGLSPANLLDSPGLGLFSPQALAQVTAQAAQVHSHLHIQPECSSSLPSSAPSTSTSQFSSFSTNSTVEQQMPAPSMLDSRVVVNESSDLFQFDQRSQPSSIAVDKPADDGYNWRKYGQKQVKGSEFPRSYYKCTHPSCPVKKKIERSLDGQVTEIIYKGQHSHQPPQSNKRAKDAANLNGNSNYQGNFELAFQFRSVQVNASKEKKDQESSQASAEHLSGSDSEEVGDTETGIDEGNEDEPDPKRRNVEVRVTEPTSSHRTVTEPRIIVQTNSEVDLLDDGYRWRKYGQKVVKGNPYPRSYYKCTTTGCKVRKHVERAAADPRAVITTYEGKHNHDVPTAKGTSRYTTNSEASLLEPRNGEKHRVNKRDFGNNDQQPVARLRLKEEQIT